MEEKEAIGLGDVVRCYPGTDHEVYGVVVRLPIVVNDPEDNAANCYRVRVSTRAFHDYVELGVFPRDLEPDPSRDRRPRGGM